MGHHDLFVSYHTPDREAISTVREFLKTRGVSSFIDREQLVAGLPWPQALEEALKDVRAVAVFLGPNGLGLWQKREMWFALDRQVQEAKAGHAFPVIPVLLPGTDPAPGFLFLNTWVDLRTELSDPKALDAIVQAIHGERVGAAEEIYSELRPYRGLEIFKEEHAAFFCGREAFIEPMLDAVLKRNLVAVIGPSGSGKSSIVQAGLVPALRRQRPPSVTWDVAIFTPDDRPYHWLATALMPFLEPGLSEVDRLAEVEKLGDHLSRGEVKLEATVKRLLEKSEGTDRLLLVADQFEELFTTTPASDRRPFVDCLLNALTSSPLTLVITMRADFYGNALSISRELSNALQQGVINLGPMERDELERAIVEPAHRVGLNFEAGLVERILDDVAKEPGHLPLLEFALTELWTRRQGRLMTHDGYDAIGEVEGALTRRAEREYSRLPPAQQKTAQRLMTQLVRVTRPEEGTEDTRKRVSLGELDEESRAVARRLAQARLLVTGGVDSVAHEHSALVDEAASSLSASNTVEVAHEALIRSWARLKDWLSENREFLLWQQRLHVAVADWERMKDEGALMRGIPLVEAERWMAKHGDAIEDREKAFIEASQELRNRDRRRALRRRIVAASLVAVVLSIGIWFWREQLTIRHAWAMILSTVGLYSPVEPEMIEITPDKYDLRFVMGSSEYSYTSPPHPVHIERTVAIGKYEVTFEEYDQFVYATGRTGSEYPSDQGWNRGQRPVINVSWEDAVAYAEWLSEETGRNYRLPSEAEWEYAARAGTTTEYWWGNDIREDGNVWANCNGCGSEWDSKQTAPVGSFDANPFGLHDTAGNVWEWVQDCWHDSYEAKGRPDDGKAWEPDKPADCGRRVIRGGSWDDVPQGLRSTFRSRYNPDYRNSYLGFRLAQD